MFYVTVNLLYYPVNVQKQLRAGAKNRGAKFFSKAFVDTFFAHSKESIEQKDFNKQDFVPFLCLSKGL
jgi:hypothetical protein